jgi:TetR/AcrR family transcriptional regulator, regulator of cefoperazone and chloramphenicol sensitivity
MEPSITTCDTSTEARETHERILEAAQKLFAEKGLDATSVRDITAAADCNVAAVNYHFGGKENLYLESFRAMLGPLRDQRLAVIGELMEREPVPTLEAFLSTFAEGFLEPLVDESKGRRFMVFVAREILDPRLPTSVFLDEFIRPLIARAVAALDRVGVPMTPEASLLCVFSLIGQLLHAVKAHHLASHVDTPEAVPFELASFLDHFVRFSAAGIRACALDENATPTTFSNGEKTQ